METYNNDIDRGGDVVVMEITVGRDGREVNACCVLTFRDGLIISDHTYLDVSGLRPKGGG